MRRVQAAVMGLALVVLLTACPGTVSLTAPSNVTATPELSAIDVNWQDESDNEQGFIVFRAAGEGDFAQVAEVGPNVTNYRDTALEADVVYRYAVAAKGSAQNSAQTVQAEAGVSVSYHGEAVRSFTGEVVDYGAEQAQLFALDLFSQLGPAVVGSGTISAQGEFTFAYDATVANLSPFPFCGTSDTTVEAAFGGFLFVGDMSGVSGGLVLASSGDAAGRVLLGETSKVGDIGVSWVYVAKDLSYQFPREACPSGNAYDLELKAGWNTIVTEITGFDPVSNQPVGTFVTAVPPANLNWYFVKFPEGFPPAPPANPGSANLFGFSGN